MIMAVMLMKNVARPIPTYPRRLASFMDPFPMALPTRVVIAVDKPKGTINVIAEKLIAT
jgi:hypothetical protein